MTGNLIMPGGAQAATQSYVNTAISNLVNAAPTALDTLKELATALNNDASFATTVTNSIASKLALSGGTLTGTLNGTTIITTGSATFGSDVFTYNNGGIFFSGGGSYSTGIFQNSNGLNLQVSGSPVFKLAYTTGAATFTGSVSIEGSGSMIRSGNELRFYRADNAIYTKLFDSGSLAANGFVLDNMNAEGFHFKNNGTTIMRMNSSNNIGINTTTPYSALHVARAGNVNGGSLLLGVATSGAAKWSYLAGAHYDQTTGSGNGSGSAGIALIGVYSNSTNNDVYIGGGPYEINAATSIAFYTHTSTTSTAGGTEKMRLTSTGRLGIGQSVPAYTLDVNGSSRMRDEIWLNSAGQSSIVFQLSDVNKYNIAYNTNGYLQFYNYVAGGIGMVINNSNNIGFGTTSPSHRVHVSGNVYSTDTVFGRNLKPEAWVSVSAGSPSGAGIPLGYSSINITSPCDNNWRTILSNINDVKGYFWVTLGDAASKDTANYMMAMTSPAYGVSNFGNVSYQDNGWNTGGFEFTTSTANGTYSLLVRCTSYYSSGSTAYGTIYFLRME
jgi:hypothetical protein